MIDPALFDPSLIDIHWGALAPVIALVAAAVVGLLLALGTRDSRPVGAVALLGLATAALFQLDLFMDARAGQVATGFGLRWLSDLPASAFVFAILLGAALAVLVSWDYVERAGLDQPEYYPLLLLATAGAVVLASAGDLIVLLLGLEIMSLAVYALSAWRQGARESEEAGMKYFLLGAFASAFLIYGIALLYGATGAFDFAGLALALAAPGFAQGALALLGGLLVLVGLGFKASLAPFHQWAPDAYTGAPTSVTAFMSVVVKTAAFAALLRFAALALPGLEPALAAPFEIAFAVIVALTMVIGNLSALVQRRVKRMLAYSAVAHAGYLGLAVLAADAAGTRAAAWYLLAYTLMNVGAFAVLTLVADRDDHGDAFERFHGLGRRRPLLAAAMTVFLLSLAGIPPFAGFTGKILVFGAAIEAGYAWLAVLGILTSVLAVVYYLRLVFAMLAREPEYEAPRATSRATGAALLIAVVGTVALGVLPGWWYGLLEPVRTLIAGL